MHWGKVLIFLIAFLVAIRALMNIIILLYP